jgi:hypothetical protein
LAEGKHDRLGSAEHGRIEDDRVRLVIGVGLVVAVPQVVRMAGTNPRIPRAVDGEGGQQGAAFQDLQSRAAAKAVMVNRAGGESEPLFKSATTGHGCLLLEWDALRYVVL